MNLRRGLALYPDAIALRAKALAEFRTSAWIWVSMRILRFGLQLSFIGVMFTLVDELGGWTAWEVALMWSIGLTGRYLLEVFLIFNSEADNYFYQGDLDYVAIRPVPAMLYASASRLPIEEVPNAAFFATVAVVSLTQIEMIAPLATIPILIVGVLTSALIWFGIGLLVYCSVGWFTRARVLYHGISALYDHGKYPLEILPLSVGVLLTVIPFAFTSYWPVAFALRLDADYWPGLLSPLIGVGLTFAGLALYRVAWRRYSSTGTAEL